MAATCLQKHVAGGRPEDIDKNPSDFQKVLEKIAQKNKNKKAESARQDDALKQTDTTMSDVPELPFVDVQPLPVVGRGQAKTSGDSATSNDVNKIIEAPKLSVEKGFKNKAPLQLDE